MSRTVDSEQVENCRQEIDVLGQFIEALAGTHLPGKFDDEWHRQLFLIQRVAVPPPAMVEELFAVVRNDQDGGGVVQPLVLQPGDKLSEMMIREGNLSIVEGPEL